MLMLIMLLVPPYAHGLIPLGIPEFMFANFGALLAKKYQKDCPLVERFGLL